VAYVRTVKTASDATAVQIVWSTRRGSRQIEHLGSAHDEASSRGKRGQMGDLADPAACSTVHSTPVFWHPAA
jgi:hypothetical protein